MEKKSQSKTKYIVIAVVIALLIAGIIFYFVQNQKDDISKYYGTYECQVEQGEAHTTYSITLNEGVNVGKPGEYLSGTYSARSTNSTFGFNYQIFYSIEKENLTIKFNQGQTISGTFTDGNLIINSIGSQTNLLFIKIK